MAKWPYNTTAWRRLRELKLASEPLCEECAREGRTVEATVADHRKAISQGGEPFPSLPGLASLCLRHHSIKTARGPEAGAVRTSKPRSACDTLGNPIDPAHPWAKNRSELGREDRRQRQHGHEMECQHGEASQAFPFGPEGSTEDQNKCPTEDG